MDARCNFHKLASFNSHTRATRRVARIVRYSPRNTGGRFSLNAAIPSWLSVVVKQ